MTSSHLVLVVLYTLADVVMSMTSEADDVGSQPEIDSSGTNYYNFFAFPIADA